MARRSQITLDSGSPVSAQYDNNGMESLTPDPSPTHAPPSGTVQYGPDQMLAVYAARGKPTGTMPMPSPTPRGFSPSAPAPGDMRSYVHLNNGQVSSNAMHNYPGQSGQNLGVPTTGTRMSSASDVSAYSEEEVGEAR